MGYEAKHILYSREAFSKAVAQAMSLVTAGKLTRSETLEIYCLYKQHIYGDIPVNEQAPPRYAFQRKRTNQAWQSQRGKSEEVAGQEYITAIEGFKAKYDCSFEQNGVEAQDN